MPKRVLAIETSCDDTSAALVEDGTRVLSCVVASQDELHAQYGGVVPELASRRHTECLLPVVEQAMERAGVGIDGVDALAVTVGPGLPGSLLVGVAFAKAAAFAAEKPLVGVNHLMAHVYATFLEGCSPPEFPFVALVVSGGHTGLFLVEDYLDFTSLGQTRDDAAGEAFDKVAKLLGLGYPGGVLIDRLAKGGNPGAVEFRRPYIAKGNLEFSFSGLKTAVLNHLKGLEHELSEAELKDLCASFQEAVVDVLCQKLIWALEATDVHHVVICGGVACNSRLRERASELCTHMGVELHIPKPAYCSDNAAMVGACAHRMLLAGRLAPLDITAMPTFEG